ncbi:MAG: PD40 domain-containing protein [Acidobacteria bacterium]|nr:PD40 domain-containing protein [Acidobacteriota bacterium]
MSGDGRLVAFSSEASNLVRGDTNGVSDVFVRDLVRGTTVRVSVSSSGRQGNRASGQPAISADGRWVAFSSSASNLVPDDRNRCYQEELKPCHDVFAHDLRTGRTVRVSASSTGEEANDSSITPAISADGRYVAFSSRASNLVAGDTQGCEEANLDASTSAGHCLDVFLRDLRTGETTILSHEPGAESDYPSVSSGISADGRYVVFASEDPAMSGNSRSGTDLQVYVYDRQGEEREMISVSAGGEPGNSSSSSSAISSDGRYVVFLSQSTNLVSGAGSPPSPDQVFVRDRLQDVTVRASVSSSDRVAEGQSFSPSISGDGRLVAFVSDAPNLVDGDTNTCSDQPRSCDDLFARDLLSGRTERVSVSSSGAQANGRTYFSQPGISADGRFVVFVSEATNLVPRDRNRVADAFLRDRKAGTTTLVSVS